MNKKAFLLDVLSITVGVVLAELVIRHLTNSSFFPREDDRNQQPHNQQVR